MVKDCENCEFRGKTICLNPKCHGIVNASEKCIEKGRLYFEPKKSHENEDTLTKIKDFMEMLKKYEDIYLILPVFVIEIENIIKESEQDKNKIDFSKNSRCRKKTDYI